MLAPVRVTFVDLAGGGSAKAEAKIFIARIAVKVLIKYVELIFIYIVFIELILE